jgi:hypothetical protein
MEKFKGIDIERLQALKLVKKFVLIDAGMVHRSIIQALVAIAEFPEDPYSRTCLEMVLALGMQLVVAYNRTA